MAEVHLGSVSVVHLETKKRTSSNLISSQKHGIMNQRSVLLQIHQSSVISMSRFYVKPHIQIQTKKSQIQSGVVCKHCKNMVYLK